MTAKFLSLIRCALVLPTTIHLVSCATSSTLDSRTRHVGSVHAIKECRADKNQAYILWKVEKDRSTATSVVDLETRNAIHEGRMPPTARTIPVVELSGESALLRKGQILPCLGVWRVNPEQAGGPFAPRVRWIDQERDFCVNLPATVAEPGRIVSRLPQALALDALFLGAIVPFSAITATGGGGGGPLSPSIHAWGNSGEAPAGAAAKWGGE